MDIVEIVTAEIAPYFNDDAPDVRSIANRIADALQGWRPVVPFGSCRAGELFLGEEDYRENVASRPGHDERQKTRDSMMNAMMAEQVAIKYKCPDCGSIKTLIYRKQSWYPATVPCGSYLCMGKAMEIQTKEKT